MERSCKSCTYFSDCSLGEDPRGYCSTNPDVVGYCALWEGERFTTEACEGWVQK